MNLEFKLHSKIYSKNAIMKCLYWYSKDFNIDVTVIDDNYKIILKPNHDLSEESLRTISRKLKQDFIDYNLRDIVKNETTPIRELIMAKAFSHGEFDEEPKGDLMDPLGIKFL